MLPVRCVISPLTVGLIAGPRLPRLLISAMPTAAAPAERYSLTSVKKIGVAAAMPIVAKHSAISDPARLPASRVVTHRPKAARATQAAKCQRRSRSRSELRPIRIMSFGGAVQ